MTLQNDRFLIFSQLTRLPISELFHLFNMLHMLDDRGMVNVKFFGNFLFTCKRIGFSDGSQLVIVSFWWPATTLLILKVLISLLNHHCPARPLAVPIPNVVDVASHLHCFTTHFELK